MIDWQSCMCLLVLEALKEWTLSQKREQCSLKHKNVKRYKQNEKIVLGHQTPWMIQKSALSKIEGTNKIHTARFLEKFLKPGEWDMKFWQSTVKIERAET